jgi:hypothetical protein
MTLRKLIEAVEAGTARPSGYGHPEEMFFAVWPPTKVGPQMYHFASRAYDGSLDAAKSLHDALLPGWAMIVGNADGEPGPFMACLRNPATETIEEGENANPARAWLLAILRALEGGEG